MPRSCRRKEASSESSVPESLRGYRLRAIHVIRGTAGLALLLAGLPCRATSADAERPLSPLSPVRYESQPGSLVQIDGTSNIHDWIVKGGIIKGFIEADAKFPESAAKAGAQTPKVEVTIPVRTLKSTVAVGAKKMDEVMQEHMNMARHPNIEYRLLQLTPKAGAESGHAFQFEATGALTVSGVTRTNLMPVTVKRLDAGKVKVTGSTALKMTDFGIKPPAPTLALGLIKTGDDVTISIEWLTAQKAAQTSTPSADAAQ